MSQRLLLALCFGVVLLIGVVVLTPLTAEDGNAPAAATSAGTAHHLAYKFQPGQVVRYETVQNAKFVSQFSGNVETALNKTELRKAYRVKKVNTDGSAELELVIEWVRMKADFGGGGVPTEFDSKDPAAKTQAKFKDVLRNVGKPQALLLVSPTGKVLKVHEMALVTPAPVGVNNIQLKDMTGKDDFNFLTVFPESAVKVGESWPEKFEIKVVVEDNLKKTLQAQRTYKLDSIEGNLVTISFKTSILTPVKDNNIAIQLIQRETTGKLVFDKAMGAVITRTVDSDKSVINPAGANTAMHSTSHLLERILTETADISDVPTESAKQ